MAAKDAINPNQLRMLMSAREIAASVGQAETFVHKPEDIAKDPDAKRKLSQSKKNGLHKRIAEEGVKKPVDILVKGGYSELVNGHHRLIASLDTNPDRLMPVMYHNNSKTVDWTGNDYDPSGDQPYRGTNQETSDEGGSRPNISFRDSGNWGRTK